MKSVNLLPSERQREHVHKASGVTSPLYGCAPSDRPLREYIEMGVLNLDKSLGPTSHEVVAWVKDILSLDKAGHSGSLDPVVTGVLPMMLGKSTKVVSALRLSGKEYICMMRIHESVPERKVRRVCKEFTGPIFQLPPIISAVKRAVRVRTIYYIDVLEVSDKFVLMKVGCESGTYIRKLCHDIGLVLGCGANMQQLRRTKTGPFTEDSLVTLHDLKDAYVFWEEDGDESYLRHCIRPMEEGLSHLSRIVIRDSAVDAVCHGAAFAVPGILSLDTDIKKGDIICLFTLKGEAVAMCKSMMDAEEMLNSDHGIAARTERVIMNSDVYPKGWHSKSE